MQPEELLFKEAMEAIEKEDIPHARELMTRLLQQNRSNSQYWVWMSGLVETVKERDFCLREALKLDPANPIAIRGLRLMGEELEDPQPLPKIDPLKQNWKTSLEVEKPVAKVEKKGKTKPSSWIALGVAVTALVVALIFLARPARYLPDTSPVIKFSLTPPATSTPKTTPTSLSTGPAPLWASLKATYTSTPIYAATPHKLTEAYQAAMKAYDKKDWPHALEYFRQALDAEPASADIQYHIGEIYRFQGMVAEAGKAYDACIKIDPSYAPAYVGKGMILLLDSAPEPDKAQQQFEKALELDPQLSDTLYELAKLSLSARDADAALEYLDRIPSSSPPSVLAEMTRAQAYLLKGDFTQALSTAQKANRIDITCLPVYKLLAQAFQLNDRVADSIPPLETYLTYEPTDSEALALMSHALIADGKYEEALQYANDALKLDKKSLPSLVARGEIYLQQEKVEEALVDFNAALRVDKNSFEANIGIARIQISKTLFGSAYEYSRVAYDLAQTDPQKATALYYRALALIGLEENNAAAKDLEELMKYPEDVLPADLYANALRVYEQVVTPTPTPASRNTPTPSATARK